MVVTGPDGEKSIPIEDLYSVVIDNQQTVMTVPAVSKLTEAGVHILICNEKHLPTSVILSQTEHYRPLGVIRNQMAMPREIKDALWDRIVVQKIVNQAKALSFCGGKPERVNRLIELSNEVKDGDAGNREGIAARIFFHEMYGLSFVRMYDDAINAALNYGYTVIRSSVAKTLGAYGFNCVLGIHHINESNYFNLADDLMEPLRPIVDMWVSENHEDLLDDLTKNQKNALAALVNEVVLIDGKKMRVRNAIDRYVASLAGAMNKPDAKLLKLPELLKRDIYNDADD